MKKIAILGCTGSIGKSTLDLVERSPEQFQVTALTAAVNVGALADAARRTNAGLAVIADEDRLRDLEDALQGSGCRAAAGSKALVEAAAGDADREPPEAPWQRPAAPKPCPPPRPRLGCPPECR